MPRVRPALHFLRRLAALAILLDILSFASLLLRAFFTFKRGGRWINNPAKLKVPPTCLRFTRAGNSRGDNDSVITPNTASYFAARIWRFERRAIERARADAHRRELLADSRMSPLRGAPPDVRMTGDKESDA